MIGQIDGCISTGKEANVYHSTSGDGNNHYAIKVFKTSILVFKDRDRYVTGEFRYLQKLFYMIIVEINIIFYFTVTVQFISLLFKNAEQRFISIKTGSKSIFQLHSVLISIEN